MNLLDIGEVARRTGLAPSALRFYEKKGLITAADRNGLRRTYRPDILARLGLITCARSAGFTVAEIASFLQARPDDAEIRRRMARKAQEVDERIGQLTRLRNSLRHATTCTHEPIVECPDFKRAIGNVASGSRTENAEAPETRCETHVSGADRQGRAGPDGGAPPEMEPRSHHGD